MGRPRSPQKHRPEHDASTITTAYSQHSEQQRAAESAQRKRTCGRALATSRSWSVTSCTISFFLCTSPLGSGTYLPIAESKPEQSAGNAPVTNAAQQARRSNRAMSNHNASEHASTNEPKTPQRESTRGWQAASMKTEKQTGQALTPRLRGRTPSHTHRNDPRAASQASITGSEQEGIRLKTS